MRRKERELTREEKIRREIRSLHTSEEERERAHARQRAWKEDARNMPLSLSVYGVATISRLLKIYVSFAE